VHRACVIGVVENGSAKACPAGYGLGFAVVKPWQPRIPMNLAPMPLVKPGTAVNTVGEHWNTPENNERRKLTRALGTQ